MKKWLFFFSLFTCMTFGSFLAYLYTYRTEFISQELSKLLKCQVSMKTLRLTSCGITIEGCTAVLKQENTLHPLFSAKKISFCTTPLELVKSFLNIAPAHILRICIEQPTFYVIYNELSEVRQKGRLFFVDQLELVDPIFERQSSVHKLRSPVIITFTQKPLCLEEICQEVLKTPGAYYDTNKATATS